MEMCVNWIHNNKKDAAGRAIILIALAGIMLSGCQSREENRRSKAVESSAEPMASYSGAVNHQADTSSSANAPAAGPVNICQRELAALAKINPRAYAVKKATFDSLLNNAAVYTSVRSQVNNQTQDALDALYKYKVQQVCSEIQYSVMQGLMSRGESLK